MKLLDLYPIKCTLFYSFLALIVFVFKGDKKKFPLFLPTCLLAGVLDLWTDVITSVYPLWEYADATPFVKAFRHFLHPFIAHFFTTFLFLQWLPSKKTLPIIFFYITGWVCIAGVMEYLYLFNKEIKYVQHWKYQYSIIADYVLYSIFYIHHSWFSKKVILRS